MNPRPSHKELAKKLRHATALVTKSLVSVLEPDVILADAMELGYSFKLEFYSLLLELLHLATPENYAGTGPPLRSYESKIQGADLYVFVIKSAHLCGIDVYLKFAVYNDVLVIVSLHADRKGEPHG